MIELRFTKAQIRKLKHALSIARNRLSERQGDWLRMIPQEELDEFRDLLKYVDKECLRAARAKKRSLEG